MPALNFSMFVEKVESGEKRCTIRGPRKRPIRAGETLFLYTGMRTKKCRRLRVVTCTRVRAINIGLNRYNRSLQVAVNGELLCLCGLVELAGKDGFAGVAQFQEYFLPKGRDYFLGDLIEW